ncbi:unnamed protein product [Orchesella dallaii]|uniref:Transcription initiation factor TFIID subunit 1 histone acetyltransferase domain-containing protein n=1 Tax=Orchesella dallaii TaxID=48710 RepID=A0ABP1RP84_9HEXA
MKEGINQSPSTMSNSCSENVHERGGFNSGIDTGGGGDNISIQFDSGYSSRSDFLEEDLYDEDFSSEEFSYTDESDDDTDDDDSNPPKKTFEALQPMEYDYDDNYDDEEEVKNYEMTVRGPQKTNGETLMPIPVPSPPPTQNHSQNSSHTLPKAAEVTKLQPSPSKPPFADVKAVFPEFKPEGVLRFSKLLKKHKRPSVWTDFAQQRRKKRKLNGNRSDKPTPKETKTNENRFWRVEYEGVHSNSTTLAPFHENLEAEVMQAYAELDPLFVNDEWRNKNEASKRKASYSWSNCPGKLWYDLIEDGVETSEFSFKSKTKLEVDEMMETDPSSSSKSLLESLENQGGSANPYFSSQSFEMVTQREWENQVIWDSRGEVDTITKNKSTPWIPRPSNAYLPYMKDATDFVPSTCVSTSWDAFSVLPVENPELVQGKWEKDVIWDLKKVPMKRKIQQKILTLDPNDDNIIINFPKDIQVPKSAPTSSTLKPKALPRFPYAKKSKLLLSKAGLLNYTAEVNELHEEVDASMKLDDQKKKNPYNISNDEYYQCPPWKRIKTNASCSNGDGLELEHAIPVMELQAPFIPTNLIGNPEAEDLRRFHRPLLKLKINRNKYVPIQLAGGNRERYSIQTAEDLSGKDGELLLIEYCEEHPPLLSQVGMCSKIKNYYGPKNAAPAPSMRYGETTEVSQAQPSPFFGRVLPGQMISTVENKMYRAPIYSHQNATSDFLLILDKSKRNSSCFIREFDSVFTAGQQIPLREVPAPKAKMANTFVTKFLEIFVRNLFKYNSRPRRLRLEDIKRVFPSCSERTLRKMLFSCAVYNRVGASKGWWHLKPKFKPRIENQVRMMMSPEDCCAYFSLLAGQQRLKDGGYDDVDENEGELKTAPWNTTRECLLAMQGKYLLEVSGSADPTGCGEGFSYVRRPLQKRFAKPVEKGNQQVKPGERHRRLGGTDADLRKMSVPKGRAVLRKYKIIEEEEIVKLNRFEIIDLLRTLSTSTLKAKDEDDDNDFERTLTKFSRQTNASFAKAKEKELYEEECQRIFELQNKALSSSDILISDDGESGDEDDDDNELKEMARKVEGILGRDKHNGRSGDHYYNVEDEEKERKELLQMILEGGENKKEKVRMLTITRTFKNQKNGNQHTKTEMIRNPEVIDAYLKIQREKEKDKFVSTKFSSPMTEKQLRMERRRLQDRLRRIKKIEEGKNNVGRSQPFPPPKPPSRKLPALKVRCSKCGEKGHMKTNKNCRLFGSEKLRVKRNTRVEAIRINGMKNRSSLAPPQPQAVDRYRVVDNGSNKIVLKRSNRRKGKKEKVKVKGMKLKYDCLCWNFKK